MVSRNFTSLLQFSTAVFWILWALTIVAIVREVNPGLIYSCFLGSRMLGSTVFLWLMSGQSLLRLEDCLVYIYATLRIGAFCLTHYILQEVRTLETHFCLFHGFAGLVLPLLAILRTMYVPNTLRGGMISVSHVPANAAILSCFMSRLKHIWPLFRSCNHTKIGTNMITLFGLVHLRGSNTAQINMFPNKTQVGM
ncbi:unnamed protein product [Brassica napus]|uniref:(rape) hypothetical protein n=1 Tax=Brassica napus TaxID=3708 RepID=A0A816JTA5_BRANA|nr:unnamed protein product [Brassica napus]